MSVLAAIALPSGTWPNPKEVTVGPGRIEWNSVKFASPKGEGYIPAGPDADAAHWQSAQVGSVPFSGSSR
jgi:hypothetical protein